MTTAQQEKYSSFVEQFNGTVSENELLSAYTTFGTGGPADLFIDAVDENELALAIRLAGEFSIPWFIIGQGSNLLVSDAGYRGLIIRNSIAGLEVKSNDMICGAGELLDAAVDYATSCSLTGMEFAAGIWGTIGGAVYGNAGAFGSQVSAVLKTARLMDRNGNVRTEGNDYFAFEYRHSRLKLTGEIVTSAIFALEPGNVKNIMARTVEIRQIRHVKHPHTACSAGSFFKNIEDPTQPFGKLAAGKLLDEIGAKGMAEGGAGVFERHANILINKGHATSQDIRRLADILKMKVKEKYGIELQEEVICLGDF